MSDNNDDAYDIDMNAQKNKKVKKVDSEGGGPLSALLKESGPEKTGVPSSERERQLNKYPGQQEKAEKSLDIIDQLYNHKPCEGVALDENVMVMVEDLPKSLIGKTHAYLQREGTLKHDHIREIRSYLENMIEEEGGV